MFSEEDWNMPPPDQIDLKNIFFFYNLVPHSRLRNDYSSYVLFLDDDYMLSFQNNLNIAMGKKFRFDCIIGIVCDIFNVLIKKKYQYLLFDITR